MPMVEQHYIKKSNQWFNQQQVEIDDEMKQNISDIIQSITF